ncbi:MAG: 5-deoxy-glucuronate isomerase [Hyphomicrobiales bacterium]
MSQHLLVKPDAGSGRVIHITPERAGWTYVGFDLWKLDPGESAEAQTSDRETCLVFVAGKGRVRIGDSDFGELGDRASPFDGKPWSIYVPAGSPWQVAAITPLELGVCTAPGSDRLSPRVIKPDSLGRETRGKGTNTRYVTNILPETEPAESLLVVEVITPGGHTSSYPPHRHDRDDLPRESLLEETYYHRLNPAQGFAFQRVYTDDRSLDEAMVVEDGDVTLVPRGYHPCAAVHGYDLYYLNVMAGPKRTWRFHNAPEHEWLLRT